MTLAGVHRESHIASTPTSVRRFAVPRVAGSGRSLTV